VRANTATALAVFEKKNGALPKLHDNTTRSHPLLIGNSIYGHPVYVQILKRLQFPGQSTITNAGAWSVFVMSASQCGSVEVQPHQSFFLNKISEIIGPAKRRKCLNWVR
jgi:hypothetical protein